MSIETGRRKQCIVFTLARPTAEVFEWLKELLDLMNNNGVFSGDGRTLDQIGQDLGVDPTSLLTVVARTPQKSALKLFRLVYSTVAKRAECRSIKHVPQEVLQNIYGKFSDAAANDRTSLFVAAYVRTLHPNLTFHQSDMKNAISTSIRSAKSGLRKLERYRQQQASTPHFDRSLDGETQDELDGDATGNTDTALRTSTTSEEDDDEVAHDDAQVDDDDDECEDEEDTNSAMIDEESEEDETDV